MTLIQIKRRIERKRMLTHTESKETRIALYPDLISSLAQTVGYRSVPTTSRSAEIVLLTTFKSRSTERSRAFIHIINSNKLNYMP
jgi:hypothetical protein